MIILYYACRFVYIFTHLKESNISKNDALFLPNIPGIFSIGQLRADKFAGKGYGRHSGLLGSRAQLQCRFPSTG